MLLVFEAIPQPDNAQRLALLAPAQRYYASHGITTVQDGAASAQEIEVLRQSAQRNELFLDVVAFAYQQMPGTSMDDFPPSREYQGRFRVGGVKLVLDGSPQGKTVTQKLTEISICAFAGPETSPIQLAQENGYFAEEGISVRCEAAPGSIHQMVGLIDGEFDMAMSAVDNVIAYVEGQGAATPKNRADLIVCLG